MTSPENKTKGTPLMAILIIFGIVAIIITAGLVQRSSQTQIASSASAAEPAAQSLDIVNDAASEEEESKQTANSNDIQLDIEQLGTPRILGNPEAPLKISEHSSFTCGACAAFHKGNFKEIKRDYIDTGKAYIVFDDFPRNRPDVLIGAAARCVPDQNYFNFVQVVFETQKDWSVMGENFLDQIKNTARFAGANNEKLEACINSPELQEILAKHQQAASETYGVNSTPTLVLNNEVVLSGLTPYEDLKKAFDAAIAKKAAE